MKKGPRWLWANNQMGNPDLMARTIKFIVSPPKKKNIELLAAMYANSGDAIMVQDFEGRIITWNHGAGLMYGYSEEEALRMSIWHLVPPDKQAEDKDITRRVEVGETTSSLETQRVTKDGRILDVCLMVTKLVDDAGKPIGIVTIARDITERKQMADKLHASEARYQSYINVTGQIGWVTNAEGEVVEDMPSLRNYTGQTYEETKGLGWAKALHPDDLEHTLQVWNKALATKNSYEVEYRMRRHDGVYRNFLARGFPVVREDGSIQEWVGTCIDITERKREENAFRASEEKYRRLFESSRDAIMTIEPPSWRFTSCNQAMAMMFRVNNEEHFISCAPWELSPERQPDGRASAEKAHEMIETALREGSHFFEWTHRRIGGEEFQVDVLLTKMESNGKVIVQATVRDITERKKADAEVHFQKMLLESQNEASIDGILNSDQNGKMIWFNRRFVEMWGIPDDVIQSRSDKDALRSVMDKLVYPEAFIATVTYLYEHKDIKGSDVLLLKDGRVFERYSSPVIGKNGIYLGRVWLFRDITESKQAEAQIESLPRRLSGSAGQPPKLPELTAERGGNETILFVEDDIYLSAAVRKSLLRLGYRVFSAINGIEALKVWNQNQGGIQLLLTDLVMPGGMTGMDLARQLLEQEPKLKVIYASGYSATVVSKDFPLQEGVNFLTKPFEMHKLAQALRDSLDEPASRNVEQKGRISD